MRLNFASILPHLIALAVIVATALVYFSPQFSGKVIQQSDTIGYRGMSNELKQYKAETGEKSLWTNSMFGGMPAYQINTVNSGNYVSDLQAVSRLGIKAPAGQFIAAMVSFYVLMVLLGVSPWISIIGALAFGFATNNLILYEAGHVTKLRALTYLPLIASGMLLAFRKRYLLGGILFGIGLGMDLAANHVQMTYYFFLTVIIWGIAELVTNIKEATLPHFAKAAAYLTVGGLLAIGSAASNLFVTYEYAEDTMRGAPILEQAAATNSANSSSEVDGLEWNYAMQWSNNGMDVLASYIPGIVGGGSAQSIDSNSPYANAMRRLGQNGTTSGPLYWGALPFTSGPAYFGAIMVLLFIIGLLVIEGPVKWWLGIGTLLTMLLSMGSNFEFLNRLFFDYFPLYSKFRTPNSILGVTSFLVPALAILTLNEIVSGNVAKEKILRSLYIGGGICLAVALFFAVIGPSMFDFTTPSDEQNFGQFGPEVTKLVFPALAEMRASSMTSDSWRTFILVALSLSLVYFFIQEKIKATPMLVGLALLTLIDVLGVGLRYLNQDDFKPQRNLEAVFTPRPVDSQIMADPDPHYRVYDASINAFNSAQPSYFHKMIGGYHAAKLQRYQDLIDRHLAQGNQGVFNMLNTKYFILPGQGGPPRVQANTGALGNAWMVDSIAIVPNSNAEIDALSTINPARAAVIHQEYRDYVVGTGSGEIKLTEYRPNKLTYNANIQQPGLAIFSEIWYGPNKGWEAYIDGESVDHIRANYVLRALDIPAGQHEIVFEFKPKSFQRGKMVSMASSLLLLLALLGYIGYQVKEAMNAGPQVEAVTNKPAAKKRGGKKK